MFRKHVLLAILVVVAASIAQAGTWKRHSLFSTTAIENVIDAGDKVYYLNDHRLFQFDKATSATIALTRQNKLSDEMIDQIYFDYENRMLFVAYANSNIDVINAQGAVFNVSAIKDMVAKAHNQSIDLTSDEAKYDLLANYVSKTINDIHFANGVAYVTIGYGYATIDETTMQVTYGVELGQKLQVNSVNVIGDDMMLVFTNSYCYYGELGETDPIHNYDRRAGSYKGYRSYPINDHKVFLLGTGKLYTLDFSTSTPTLKTLVAEAPTNVQPTPDGFIANYAGKNYYYTIDAEGTTATQVTTSGIASCDPHGDGTVWIYDANGLHESGSTTYYMKNSINTVVPYWLKYNAHDGLLYVASSAPNLICVNSLYPNAVDTYDGNTWTVVTPTSSSGSVGYEFVFHPQDPTTYVRATWSKGIYKVTNNEAVMNYTENNSLIGKYKAHPAFDNYGNMWVVSSYGNPTCPVAVLPAAKFEKTTVKQTDWFQPSGLLGLSTGDMQRSRFVISRKNNVKMYSDCEVPNTAGGNGLIHCWDNLSADVTVDNYRHASINHFMDQNNRAISWGYINHMEQDNDGIIWVGHTAGLFSYDPADVFSDMPRAKRYPSENGRYLCEGYSVYDIACDRDNNKWLATNNGVYYVAADGSKVIQHFTTSNSDLPSDIVYSIECDTVQGRVYIFSSDGFAEYMANSGTAALDFENVYAHPNPVEPDYTGMIVIDGLMEDSYVTVTNRRGSVVAQFGPVTGKALWDGSGANGERVATGIYRIYAAQGQQPATTGTPNATVMIIK